MNKPLNSQNSSKSIAKWPAAFRDATLNEFPDDLIRPKHRDFGTQTPPNPVLPAEKRGEGPLVSVIIPTYRDSGYLVDALESVGSQTYDHIEVIIVDASDVPWVQSLAENYPWISYHSQEPDGISAARNRGVEIAEGEYVAFLDADDYWHPEKIERQVRALEHGGDICFTAYYFLNYWLDDGFEVSIAGNNPTRKQIHVDVLTRNVDAHISTLMVRRASIPREPFKESLVNFEDVVFAVECLFQHSPIHLTEPLGVRRLRPLSLADRTDEITKSKHRIAGYEYLAREYPEMEPPITHMIAREEYRVGLKALEMGREDVARTQFLNSFRRNSNVKSLLLLLSTYVPIGFEKVSSALDVAANLRKRQPIKMK